MRVLHVDTARDWRGGQNQVLLTATEMAARGHDVVLACRSAGVLERRAREHRLPVKPVPFRGDFSPGAAVALSRVVGEVRPDIVQLHDPHAVGAVFVPARLRGLRAVATRRVDFPIRGTLSRIKYGCCLRVIAVSRAIAEVLERDRFPAERVRVVYEGVADRMPPPGGRELLRSLGIAAGSLVVGNVAALTGHKDHATMMEAAARVVAVVPQARFVVFGAGDLRRPLEARAAALGLGERFLFAGFRSDLDAIIPAFDVFCLSSQMEGLGTSLLDAMAFARPVVATMAGGIPEAVEDGVTGRLVPVRDPQSLADALVALLCDAGTRAAFGAAGRRRFLERFTATRMVSETLKVYEELL
jgi:L-malate glycosyltransferase